MARENVSPFPPSNKELHICLSVFHVVSGVRNNQNHGILACYNKANTSDYILINPPAIERTGHDLVITRDLISRPIVTGDFGVLRSRSYCIPRSSLSASQQHLWTQKSSRYVLGPKQWPMRVLCRDRSQALPMRKYLKPQEEFIELRDLVRHGLPTTHGIFHSLALPSAQHPDDDVSHGTRKFPIIQFIRRIATASYYQEFGHYVVIASCISTGKPSHLHHHQWLRRMVQRVYHRNLLPL